MGKWLRRHCHQSPTAIELELMKEKAESLGRTGAKLEGILEKLDILDARIQRLQQQGKEASELNPLIAQFNEKRSEASRYLHYLIIQREAMGFCRHTGVMQFYKIPPKKDFIRERDVQ